MSLSSKTLLFLLALAFAVMATTRANACESDPPATPPASPPGTPPASPPATPPASPPATPPAPPPATPPASPPAKPPPPPAATPPPPPTATTCSEVLKINLTACVSVGGIINSPSSQCCQELRSMVAVTVKLGASATCQCAKQNPGGLLGIIAALNLDVHASQCRISNLQIIKCPS